MNTQSKEVNLTKRIKTEDGWRWCPVVLTAKGHVRQDMVLVKDIEERHPEGVYYIEWRQHGKRIRQSVGTDATEANNRRLAKEAELNAVNAGVPILAQTNGNRTLLTVAIAEFLEETKLHKKDKTYSAYNAALRYFRESCHKTYLHEIERRDLLKFSAFLRDEKGLSPRSVYNKFEVIMTFLKAQGIRSGEMVERGGLGITKHDWPNFVEEEPEIYEKEELQQFLSACDEDERVWFEFFLMTGMREQEVMHTYWSDVNLPHSTVKVTHKPDRGWTPKMYKEREIPIPEKLVRQLKAWKAKSDKTCNLLFPTSGCRPKLDFLDCCKAIAKRAGLNPEHFWLHKFRSTFCTTHLRAGSDLRTCQHWMGHKDIESTMRYLKPNRSEAVREQVNSAFGD
jgi:integrase/recombinase XerD